MMRGTRPNSQNSILDSWNMLELKGSKEEKISTIMQGLKRWFIGNFEGY